MTRPHVLASVATSIDGFLDDDSPRRLVLSGPADLDRVDAERAGVDAILVGGGTVRADDPRLLVRSAERRASRVARGRTASPLRVVLTRRGHLDPTARVFTEPGADVLVLAAPGVVGSLGKVLEGRAAVVASSLEPCDVLRELDARGVVRLMIEGGAAVHHAFLAAGAVDELALVITPHLVGAGVRFVGAPADPSLVETRRLDSDVLLRYRLGTPDERWLAEACALAERCPPSDTAFSVGAVVVAADGTPLATGFSRRDDPADHAEEVALRALDPADPRLATATLYSSLEPCAHRRSRPLSCAERILAAGVRRVVFAWREPPRFVAEPRGASRLADAGVEVVECPRWTALARRPNP